MHLDQFEQPVSSKQINALLSEHFNLVVPITKLHKKSVIKLKEHTSNKLNVIRNSSLLHESQNNPEYLGLLVLEGLLKTWMRENRILKEVVKCSRCDDEGWIRCSPTKCKGDNCKRCFGDKWRYCPKCNISGKNVKVDIGHVNGLITEANGETLSRMGNAALNGIHFLHHAKKAWNGDMDTPYKYRPSDNTDKIDKTAKTSKPAKTKFKKGGKFRAGQNPGGHPEPMSATQTAAPATTPPSTGVAPPPPTTGAPPPPAPTATKSNSSAQQPAANQSKPHLSAKFFSLMNTIQRANLSDGEKKTLMNSFKTAIQNNPEVAATMAQKLSAPGGITTMAKQLTASGGDKNPRLRAGVPTRAPQQAPQQAPPTANHNQQSSKPDTANVASKVASALINQGFKRADINNAVGKAVKNFTSSGNEKTDISNLFKKSIGQLRGNTIDGNDDEV